MPSACWISGSRTADHDPVPPPRGGVPFYLDPAWAAAASAETVPPVVDAPAERSCLAALLRELLVGRPYLDFSADRSRMLRQIIEERPVPFIRHGARPWTEVERVLHRALAKEAGARFASVAEFADALAGAERPAPTPGPDGAAAGLLRSFLDWYRDRWRRLQSARWDDAALLGQHGRGRDRLRALSHREHTRGPGAAVDGGPVVRAGGAPRG